MAHSRKNKLTQEINKYKTEQNGKPQHRKYKIAHCAHTLSKDIARHGRFQDDGRVPVNILYQNITCYRLRIYGIRECKFLGGKRCAGDLKIRRNIRRVQIFDENRRLYYGGHFRDFCAIQIPGHYNRTRDRSFPLAGDNRVGRNHQWSLRKHNDPGDIVSYINMMGEDIIKNLSVQTLRDRHICPGLEVKTFAEYQLIRIVDDENII